MLLSGFDQESAPGESLCTAANSTPPGCAWHIQVRSLLNYIKLGDVPQPLTGIQCWNHTTTSPKETPKTRTAQMEVSQHQAFGAHWSVWPALNADKASQQWCCEAPTSKIWEQRLSNAYSPSKTLLNVHLCQHPSISEEFKLEILYTATEQHKKSLWNSQFHVWKNYECLAWRNKQTKIK